MSETKENAYREGKTLGDLFGLWVRESNAVTKSVRLDQIAARLDRIEAHIDNEQRRRVGGDE